jgi:hypothetical protein
MRASFWTKARLDFLKSIFKFYSRDDAAKDVDVRAAAIMDSTPGAVQCARTRNGIGFTDPNKRRTGRPVSN